MRNPCSSLAALFAGFLINILIAPVATAQVPMTGRFVAEARCPALQSIRRQSNPGAVAVVPGQAYELVGRNAEEGTHYYVVVPDADPERRWVAIGCGRIEAEEGSVAKAEEVRPEVPPRESALQEADRGGGDPADRSGSGIYVLAISWQSAFCEFARRRPECRHESEESRAAATRFSLHGLWPGPRGEDYCGVERDLVARDREGDWRDLPRIRLTEATATALREAMPGVLSGLDRHEWVRHGTCYGQADAEEYFADSLMLLAAINRSDVQATFAGSVGQYLSDRMIRGAFERAFGTGAGDRVAIVCREDGLRTLISELRISLSGGIGPDSDLGRLISNAAPVRDRGCRGGTIDPRGLQ